MQDNLTAAIHDAVSQVVAEHGGLVQGFLCQIDYIDSDGAESLLIVMPDNQSLYTTWAMANNMALMLDEMRRWEIRPVLD